MALDLFDDEVTMENGPLFPDVAPEGEITQEAAVEAMTDIVKEIAVDLEDRKTFIGGSDAAAILGISPWTSRVELWMQKTGKKPVVDISTVEQVMAGQVIEASIAELYTWKYKRKLRRVNERVVLESAPYPMVAQIDRKVEGERCVIELKNVDRSKRDKWGVPESGDIPDYYYAQVMHQLAVTRYERAEVVPLFGGNKTERYFLEYASDFIADLMEAEAQFWECVKNDTPPEPLTPDECKELWGKSEPARVSAEAIAAYLVGFIFAEQGKIKVAETRIAAAKTILMRMLQAKGDTLTVGGKPVCTWKPQKRKDFDTELFRQANPELYQYYLKESTTRVFRISKAGKETIPDMALVEPAIADILAITSNVENDEDQGDDE